MLVVLSYGLSSNWEGDGYRVMKLWQRREVEDGLKVVVDGGLGCCMVDER